MAKRSSVQESTSGALLALGGSVIAARRNGKGAVVLGIALIAAGLAGSQLQTVSRQESPRGSSPGEQAAPSPSGWGRIVFSVYADRYHGRTAADGSVYDHFRNTVACNFLPLGTTIVCRVGGREVEAVVTDRMDRELGKKRIDLSGGAMFELSPGYDFTDATAPLVVGEWRLAR